MSRYVPYEARKASAITKLRNKVNEVYSLLKRLEEIKEEIHGQAKKKYYKHGWTFSESRLIQLRLDHLRVEYKEVLHEIHKRLK